MIFPAEAAEKPNLLQRQSSYPAVLVGTFSGEVCNFPAFLENTDEGNPGPNLLQGPIYFKAGPTFNEGPVCFTRCDGGAGSL